MRVLRVGREALLVECENAAQARALAGEAWRRRAGGQLRCADIVPAARTVLLDGLPGGGAQRLAAQLPAWRIQQSPAADERLVRIAVAYDGPDLARVAELWGTTPEGVIERHTGQVHTAAFCGFAPGFAYLAGLPDELAVPRLERPRTAVPAGAVGLADRYTGVYPRRSPGGWLLIGTARDVVLFDPERDPPALLAPGTRVQFTVAGRGAAR